MALEDKDIFNAIFNKYSDQPIEFIMEQYEKAKILRACLETHLSIMKRFNSMLAMAI